MPAPSPTTKPSRCASNGRLACPGSSLRVESAFIDANPPMPIGVIAASVPPQIIISAAPRSIILNESPIACAEAEHAVAEFGPRAPYRIEMCGNAALPGQNVLPAFLRADSYGADESNVCHNYPASQLCLLLDKAVLG